MAKWIKTENGKPRYFRLVAVKNDGDYEFAKRTLSGWVSLYGGLKLKHVTEWYYLPED